MRSSLEKWLLGYWYGSQTPPWYLRALEPSYRFAYKRAQKRQLAKLSLSKNQAQTQAPLIVVGNITAGGSGKTPLVIRLCELAREMGLNAGIASTGYGRQAQQTMRVSAESDTNECGDEPVMLAQRTGVPVVVATHRAEAVHSLNEMDLDLVISDDGLQHLDLGADIEICVVDGQRGLGNGHLIPAGPLREPVDRLYSVDHLVTNGVWDDKPADLSANLMQLVPTTVKPLNDGASCSKDEFLEFYGAFSIHAFAGIGNPQRFFGMLQSMGFELEEHVFADHHNYTKQDFDVVPEGAIVLMTEKDAVKCRLLGLKNSWYVEVEAHMPDDFESILKLEIANLIEDRKT